MFEFLTKGLCILALALIVIGVPYCLMEHAKTNGAKGCVIGGCLGPVLFFFLIAVSNDAPEMGGIFVIPFFLAGGGLLGWIIGAFIRPRKR